MTTRTLTNLMKRSFSEMMKDVATSTPGHILSFNPSTQLAQVQIGIKRLDVNGDQFVPPPLIECPVYFAGGSYCLEHQIDPGDEGVILFSQRFIDTWVNSGGVANLDMLRFHDFSDAYFLPGLRSQPNKLAPFVNNGIRLRDKAADNYIWLKNDNTAEIKIDTLVINGNVVHNGNTTQTGSTATSGSVTAATSISSPSIVSDGKEMTNHTHPAGTPPGNTGSNN